MCNCGNHLPFHRYPLCSIGCSYALRECTLIPCRLSDNYLQLNVRYRLKADLAVAIATIYAPLSGYVAHSTAARGAPFLAGTARRHVHFRHRLDVVDCAAQSGLQSVAAR